MHSALQTPHKPPLKLRRLRADMILKNLTLGKVARRARVHKTTASSVLKGKLINAKALEAIAGVIAATPMEGE